MGRGGVERGWSEKSKEEGSKERWRRGRESEPVRAEIALPSGARRRGNAGPPFTLPGQRLMHEDYLITLLRKLLGSAVGVNFGFFASGHAL